MDLKKYLLNALGWLGAAIQHHETARHVLTFIAALILGAWLF